LSFGGDAPTAFYFTPVEQRENDIGVAGVNREQHGFASL
jgi:hypothetical protein